MYVDKHKVGETMENEYGFKEHDGNPDVIWSDYSNLIKEINVNDNKKYKKCIGALAATVFKTNIERVLLKYGLDKAYKVSENNAFVEGIHTEFDYLIVKNNAMPIVKIINGTKYELPIYNKENVVAVLECKANGIYTTYDKNIEETYCKYQLRDFVESVNNMRNEGFPVKIGYMTMSEQRSQKGKSNQINNTIDFLKDPRNGEIEYEVYFSRCEMGKKHQFALDDSWEKFVLNLVGYYDVE